MPCQPHPVRCFKSRAVNACENLTLFMPVPAGFRKISESLTKRRDVQTYTSSKQWALDDSGKENTLQQWPPERANMKRKREQEAMERGIWLDVSVVICQLICRQQHYVAHRERAKITTIYPWVWTRTLATPASAGPSGTSTWDAVSSTLVELAPEGNNQRVLTPVTGKQSSPL